MSELFADGEFVRTIDAQKLMKGLFYFAADMQNVGLGISFYDLFTTDELYGLNVYDNYKYYVIRGPSPLNRRFPQAVVGGAVSADLRFGHDGNLMTFVSLLQFEGCDVVESDPEKIAQMWPLYRISPMAANIQLVFYRKKAADDVLVKFLYNEREVRIPVASDLAPYYRWNDVRDFYRNVMENLPDPAAK